MPLDLAMRKSLVTFGSVESQWNDKGRSQIARREGQSGGSGSGLFFQDCENRMLAAGVAGLRKAFFFFFKEGVLKHICKQRKRIW